MRNPGVPSGSVLPSISRYPPSNRLKKTRSKQVKDHATSVTNGQVRRFQEDQKTEDKEIEGGTVEMLSIITKNKQTSTQKNEINQYL